MALFQVLHVLLTSTAPAEQDHWDIVVTGHSFGGALASLCSFELARIRAGAALTMPEAVVVSQLCTSINMALWTIANALQLPSVVIDVAIY